MSGLSLNLLGPYTAALDGQPLGGFRTRLAQALFIYLACEPQRHRREHLMALLWPGLPEASAQQNLRQNLYFLRRSLPAEVASAAGAGSVPLVLADRDAVQFNPDAAVVVDARRFAALIDRLRPGLGELEEAVALYRGDFLTDFYLLESNPFEEWAAARREAYRRGALSALERLAAYHLADEDFAAAETYARRQLAVDPLHEAGHRQLIELLARGGRRSAALAHFDDYRRLLHVELGVKPGSETLALVGAVQAGELLPAARRPDHIRGYDIHEELGRGSYGVVFRASQPAIGRDVAIKVIPARYADDVAFIHRFEVEAQTIARLEHPQIVPLYDYWREPGNAYLVMRYLRGGNLRAALAGGPWEVTQAARLLDQMAAALAVAHRHGVVHRDVKPANVLLDEDGNAYLTDFGIAKLLRPEGTAGGATEAEMFAGTPEYVSPEQLLSEDVTPLSDQYSLGLVVYEALAGVPPFMANSLLALLEMHARAPLPSLHESRPELPAALDAVLRRATAKRPAERYPDIVAFAEAFRTAVEVEMAISATAGFAVAAPLLDVDNPYKGLLAFSEADEALFYGREALTQQLLDRLAPSSIEGGGSEGGGRFLAVVGPSGSGKSSLVMAGLVPALRGGAIPGSEKWFILDMIPGAHPYEELETALLRIAVNPPAALLEQLQDGERGLLRAVRRILPDNDGQLLLIIDQFEELFTLVEDGEVTARFLESLVAAVNDPRSPLRVVVTLRADFYDRPLRYPGLSELFRERTEVIVPLSTDELVRAIEQPAQRVGVEVQPELVAALVADANDQPGALPLLQYTLSELFEERENGVLTLDAYRRLGGVSGALAQRAEAVYGALDDAGQSAACALFSRLVTLGEGVEDTSRRVLRSELEALEITNEEVVGDGDRSLTGVSELVTRRSSLVTPLDAFGHARLLAFDRDPLTRGPTVEIAHEALLRAWPRLRGWLDEDRAALRLSRLLTAAAAEWEASGRADGFLLRGARLDQLAPLAGGTIALTDGERRFLAASLDARESRRAAEEARRQAEIATAQKLAETERQRADEQTRSAGRLRQRAALLAGALGLALILAVVALSFARSSARNADVASTREAEALANAGLAATREAEASANAALAATRQAEAQAEAGRRAAAESDANEQRDLALAREREALESYSLALAANARQALDAEDQPLALLLALAANEIDTPPLDAWRTLLDIAYAPGAVREYVVGSEIRGIDVSPDGQTMLTGSVDGLVRLWDIASGQVIREYDGGDRTYINNLKFSPDGRLALVGGGDGSLLLWDVASGELIRRLPGYETGGVRAIAFLPDGRHALTGSEPTPAPGELILWDLDTGEIARRYGEELGDSIEGVRSIAVAPGGRFALVGFASVSNRGALSAVLFDLETGEARPLLDIPDRSINEVAISSDGRLAFGASADTIIYVWDIESGALLHQLRGHQALATAVAAGPDSLTALSGAGDGELIRWNLATGEIDQRFSGHSDAVRNIDNVDGAMVVTVSVDGTARLWDVDGQWQVGRWRDPQLPTDRTVDALELSPDGRRALAATSQEFTAHDPVLALWDYETGTIIRRMEGVDDWVMDVAFLPDGRRALVSLGNGVLGFWDLETGQPGQRLEGHDRIALTIDVSSDGRFALTGSGDVEVAYWNLSSGKILRRLYGHFIHFTPTDVRFLPGDRQALSTAEDGAIVLWDLDTGEQIRRLTGLAGRVGSHLNATGIVSPGIEEVAVTADGRHLLSAADDGTLLLWDVATGDSIRRFTGHAQVVWSVALSPDERLALSGATDDYAFILWDVATGKPIRRFADLAYPGEQFPWVAIHPDGRTAVVSDVGGVITQLQLTEPSPAELVDWLAANRVMRELTCLERETYRIQPLCVDGQPLETTADMLADVRQATAALDIDAAPPPEPPAAPLNLTPPERPPQTAAIGENRGELARGEFDVWLYEGRAGEVLSLRMNADRPLPTTYFIPYEDRFESGSLDPVLAILGPDGTRLDFSNDDIVLDPFDFVADAYIRAVRLPADGVYRIEARSAWDDTAGGYTLILEPLPAVWHADLYEEYTGHYLLTDFNLEAYLYIDEGRFFQYIASPLNTVAEWAPLSETEFAYGGATTFTMLRDENGNVSGFEIVQSYDYIFGGIFGATRLGDLPPDFLPP